VSAAMTKRHRGHSDRRLASPGLVIAAIVLLIVFSGPLLLSAFASVRPTAGIFDLVGRAFTSANYSRLANYGAGLTVHGGNSVIVAVLTVAVTCVLSALAGYGFAHFSWRGREIVFLSILAILMVPFQTVLVPLFVLLRWLSLDNSLLGLALVYATFQLPFAVFMMRNAFETVPREIKEAALLDGCSEFGVFRVMLPIVAPGIVTVALFAFLASWNEFLGALILLSDADKQTLPLMLQNATVGNFGTVNWGALQAGVVITMLPAAIIFLALQRYYVSGLTGGAIKA
jgi:multiple sugar transport system permease protein